MKVRAKNVFTTIRAEGAMLPIDLLQRIVDNDQNLDGLTSTSYHLLEGEKLNEAINRSWSRLRGAWASFRGALEKLPPMDLATKVTRNRILLPLFQELGYGRLTTTKTIAIEGKTYPISYLWLNTPIHLVGYRVDLDKRTAGVAGAARSSPHSLVQELLNRSDDHLWAFVSNGQRLRILRDNASLTRQAYVEFDLEAMMAGEVYADFVLLWLLCHQSRVEAEKSEQCWLETWSKIANDQGKRALDALRDGVEATISSLGQGFLTHSANRVLRQKLQSGELATQDYYRQLLRLVYRLLFLFVAEDRELLLDPNADQVAKDRYTLYYSTARLRSLAEKRRGTRHNDLFHGLLLVMEKLSSETGCPELALPALNGFLWSEEATSDLEPCQISNLDLLEAIRALAYITDKHGRRAVDYKNLQSEELGSVYESLLELHPELNIDAGKFELKTVGGNERKTTGSYYTPDSLVQCLVDSALDPVLDEAVQQQDPEAAILALRVCDPACGSGHFLIAAAHRIAKRLASIRTGDEEPPPAARQTALRDTIGYCIYGVDINPMAVELCKVALCMEAVEPGRPLPFLEHHIRQGNSLLGTTPRLIGKGIPNEAFKPIEGDDKAVCSQSRKQNKREREKQQLTLVDPSQRSWQWLEDVTVYAPELQPWKQLEEMAARMEELDRLPGDSLNDIYLKQKKYKELLESTEYRFTSFRADAWCAAFVIEKISQFEYLITEEVFRKIKQNPLNAPKWLVDEIARLKAQHHFFHWHVAFPHIFHVPKHEEDVSHEGMGWSGGFNVVLGNPPFINAVEVRSMSRIAKILRFINPLIEGSADLAYYFFGKSLELIDQRGRLGFIQPRPVLNSPAAGALRANLRQGFKPNMIYAPGKSKLFPGALVFTCLIVVGSDSTCRVSRSPDPNSITWTKGSVNKSNWWFALEELISGITLDFSNLEASIHSKFEVFGSMTTGEAYDIKAFIIDRKSDSSLKLVTTGLIDPNECFWGNRVCRYLRSDYMFPRVAEDQEMSETLRRRLATAHRPKILVAGLSRKIECFIDTEGEFIGAKSTYTILHPEDDISVLRQLCEYLLSPFANQIFISELGANAVGGGDIVMKKKFLQDLPIPKDIAKLKT
ncbi:MAG: N-6 DNA methylase [Pseudanabaenales cyanobacterium]|nr:N-6 DNA methylase [Pseudanabaenales cyanobacterium]